MEELQELSDDQKENNKQGSDMLSPLGSVVTEIVGEGISIAVDGVGEPVVNFLKEKFDLASDAATEVATKLSGSVIDQIEKFDGENISNIASDVLDAIKSIELPDIDFPDIDI